MLDAEDAGQALGQMLKDTLVPIIRRLEAVEAREVRDGANGRDGTDGRNGVDGVSEPGRDGRDGQPGRDGKDGIDGAAGKDGRDGVDAVGTPGRDGQPGRDGKDGIDGAAGKDGKDGQPGADGIGFGDFTIDYDGERTITLRAASGSRVIEKTLRFPMTIDRGVYQPERAYEQGDGVTWAGSYWIAKADTNSKPDGVDWRLAVKKGRDARP